MSIVNVSRLKQYLCIHAVNVDQRRESCPESSPERLALSVEELTQTETIDRLNPMEELWRIANRQTSPAACPHPQAQVHSALDTQPWLTRVFASPFLKLRKLAHNINSHETDGLGSLNITSRFLASLERFTLTTGYLRSERRFRAKERSSPILVRMDPLVEFSHAQDPGNPPALHRRCNSFSRYPASSLSWLVARPAGRFNCTRALRNSRA